ncbi:MAG: hypothetical protein AB2L14_21100 [Candidatus Xenobiia bacterium LiM19]
MGYIGMQIDQILRSGFNLEETGSDNEYRGLAFLSLRIALKAYFSTYHCANSMKIEYNELNQCQNMAYQEACSEAIIHFHHFIELILKDILKQKHPLLIVDATKKPKIYYKLLTGQSLDESEDSQLNQMNTVEFYESLQRICKLADDNEFETQINEFVTEYKSSMEKINTLRNRLLHRGRFILNYEALDNLYGIFVLPLALKITNISHYSSQNKEWKYRKLECNIDPINEIIEECKNDTIDAKKIALLKELARAAYENPLNDMLPSQVDVIDEAERQLYLSENEEIKRKYEAYCKADISILKADHGDYIGRIDIKECPVCGLKTMLIHDWGDGKEPFFLLNDIPYPNVDVSCRCCSFEVNNNLSNSSKYGYSIEDFWIYDD